MALKVLGLDIGGANLKAAHSCGAAGLLPFALWREPAQLVTRLHSLLAGLPEYDLLAVTMTGELCDCFESRRQGVEAILSAVDTVAASRPVRVWQHTGVLAPLEKAWQQPLQAASANWHALATWAGRFAQQGSGVLIDIGSTTTDIVPLDAGRPVPRAVTDPERIPCRELVYTGVRRTPVCALLGAKGAAEFFATTQDVYLTLGDLSEDASDVSTADGRPSTRPAALSRLARMFCGDVESCSEGRLICLARQVKRRQIRVLRRALRHVLRASNLSPATIVTAGSGEFLIDELLKRGPFSKRRRVSLACELGPELSSCACAYAVAILAVEEKHDAVTSAKPIVAKVGGSLYDMCNLRSRLSHWIESLGAKKLLLVPGGGPLADVVRQFDRCHQLGEENSHWLALSTLGLNARFLAHLVRDAEVVYDVKECDACWAAGRIPILDVCSLARRLEETETATPHTWAVTSDSMAAVAARAVGASKLYLLKSLPLDRDISWAEAARQGIVDCFFPSALGELDAEVVCLRE